MYVRMYVCMGVWKYVCSRTNICAQSVQLLGFPSIMRKRCSIPRTRSAKILQTQPPAPTPATSADTLFCECAQPAHSTAIAPSTGTSDDTLFAKRAASASTQHRHPASKACAASSFLFGIRCNKNPTANAIWETTSWPAVCPSQLLNANLSACQGNRNHRRHPGQYLTSQNS